MKRWLIIGFLLLSFGSAFGANVNIEDLSEIVGPASNDVLPIVDVSAGNTTKKITLGKLRQEAIDLRDYLPSGYVTNGSVNYTTQIQAAITAAGATKTVYIPEGTWLHTGLTLLAGTQLRGAGRGRTILTHNTAGYALDYSSNTEFYNGIVIQDMTIQTGASSTGGIRIGRTDLVLGADSKHHIYLHNLFVTGPTNGSSYDTVGVNLAAIAQSEVSNCEIKQYRKGLLMSGTTNNQVRRNRIWYVRYAVHYAQHTATGGIETMIDNEILWGDSGTDGYGLKVDVTSLRNYSPYYETSPTPATVNTAVWITTGVECYEEIYGRYDFTQTAGIPTMTAGITIEAGALKCRFIGMHGSCSGTNPSVAAIGAPAEYMGGVLHRHEFLFCDINLMESLSIKTAADAGYVNLLGHTREGLGARKNFALRGAAPEYLLYSESGDAALSFLDISTGTAVWKTSIFWDQSEDKLGIDNGGLGTVFGGSVKVDPSGVSTYADNAAALAGDLTAGQFYRTATGQLMIVYTP